jgi:hypothetical protein
MHSSRVSRVAFRVTLATATALVLCASVVGATVADTRLSSSGRHGKSSLGDSSTSAGAMCSYTIGFGADINAITIEPPNVLARNRSSGADSQKVGWRFVVQRLPAGAADWTPYYLSPISKAMATDASPATFSPRGVAVVGSDDADDFRVLVKIFWYRADGSRAGKVVRSVDYYHWQSSNGSEDPAEGFQPLCPAHFGF